MLVASSRTNASTITSATNICGIVHVHVRAGLDKYAICELACKTYTAALSPGNLQSSFRKAGIYPFDPSTVYESIFLQSKVLNRCNSIETTVKKDKLQAPKTSGIDNQTMPSDEMTSGTTKENGQEEQAPKPDKNENDNTFFKKWEESLDKIEKVAKKRMMLHCCRQSNNREDDTIQTIEKYHMETAPKSAKTSTKKSAPKTTRKSSAQPDPHGTIERCQVLPENDSSTDEEIEESEKCCVCHLYRPTELTKSDSIYFTSWGQCMYDNCGHWTRLKYYCEVTSPRARDTFYCPCHGIPCMSSSEE